MSMPQYMEIAVVSVTEDGLALIDGIEAITRSGIAPRYRLVTIQLPQRPDVTPFGQLDDRQIKLWVALDDESMRRCRWRYRLLAARPGYDRGFYDQSLPVAVVRIKDRQAFEALTERVWDAFCASS